MSKGNFPRFWEIKAADAKTELTFGPLAIRYDWSRTSDTRPGEMKLSICNLNPDHRAFVERKGVNLELDAGYRDHHGRVFKGAVEFGSSTKDRGNRWTELTLKDGAIHWRNIFMTKAFAKGTDVKVVLEEVLKSLQGLPKEVADEFQSVNTLAKGEQRLLPTLLHSTDKPSKALRINYKKDSDAVKSQKKKLQFAKQDAHANVIKLARADIARGAALEKLQYLCNSFGLTAILDLQTLHIVPDEFALNATAEYISPATGLLSSPKKISFSKVNHYTAETGWEFDCELDHTLRPGGLVYLDSDEFSGPLLIARLEGHGQSHDGGEWKNTIKAMEYDANATGQVIA